MKKQTGFGLASAKTEGGVVWFDPLSRRERTLRSVYSVARVHWKQGWTMAEQRHWVATDERPSGLFSAMRRVWLSRQRR